ncbi:ribose-5-phosphate isomerase RpiA [soil metagenome]
MTLEEQKRAAAAGAMRHVESGMKLGLGTGSTASAFVSLLGASRFDGLCVPTSEATRRLAEGLGLRLSTLDETPDLDLTVDGADEIDPELRVIKGGGGALLREKIVAAASRRMIVVADESKRVDILGAFPLPVEVVPFGLKATMSKIEALCACPVTVRRRKGDIFITENGNYIVDCAMGRIPEPEPVAAELSAIPGVVEHGLFIGMVSLLVLPNATVFPVPKGVPI